MEALKRTLQSTPENINAQFTDHDLNAFCQELLDSFSIPGAPYNALQFVQSFQKLKSLSIRDIDRMMNDGSNSHILIQNDLLKVVLIHWEPGKISSIHGHPEGGCVFKVLYGSLTEKRYRNEDPDSLIAVSEYSKGGLAYIDDRIALHSVGNNSSFSAISIHAYTPGSEAIMKK